MVLSDELREIAKRRKVAKQRDQLPEGSVAVEKSLVGLALSGGGVRSSAVCLGVVQTLVERKLFPLVDYLSTVSGGGYAGAILSSKVLAGEEGVTSESHDSDGDLEDSGAQLDFEAEGAGYLHGTGAFLNRYVIGTVQNLCFVLSVLIFAGSACAAMLRSLDSQTSSAAIKTLGLETDIGRAMFPAIVLAVLWALTWLFYSLSSKLAWMVHTMPGYSELRTWLRGRFQVQKEGPPAWQLTIDAATWLSRRWARTLMVSTLIALGLGLATLLGTGEINVSKLVSADTASKSVTHWAHGVRTLMFSALGATLLPYLRPAMLFRSGAAPRNPAEKLIFWLATRAAVLGVPFFFVAIFASENISGWHEDRFPFFHRNDITAYDERSALFASLTNEEFPEIWRTDYVAHADLSLLLLDVPQRQPAFEKGEVLNGIRALADARIKMADYHERRDDTNPLTRGFEYCTTALSWSQFPLHLLGVNLGSPRNRFEQIYELELESHATKDRVVRHLNYRLMDPKLNATFCDCALTEKLFNNVLPFLPKVGEKSPDKDSWEKDVASARDAAKTAGENLSKDRYDEARARDVVVKNRELLCAVYGSQIKPDDTIYARNVLEHDQGVRWQWCFAGFVGVVVFGCCVDLNKTSWHGFYSQCIGDTFINKRVPADIKLANWRTTDRGRPLHLITGWLHSMEWGKPNPERTAFQFSPQYCGSPRSGYVRTDQYMFGDLTVRDALGISGAAVTPILTRNLLVTATLFLANIRLGQWLPNPRSYEKPEEKDSDHSVEAGSSRQTRDDATIERKSDPFVRIAECVREVARWMLRVAPVSALRGIVNVAMPFRDRSVCFVADGGHGENLGIEPLLQRQCKLIVAVDATEDAAYEFRDFVKLMRLARRVYGIRFSPTTEPDAELNLEQLMRISSRPSPIGKGDMKRADTHFFTAQIHYPDREEDDPCYLVYIKSSMTGDEPQELLSHQAENIAFPHDPTSDQFYDADRFESYRLLGRHIAKEVIADLTFRDAELGKVWTPSDLIKSLTRRRIEISSSQVGRMTRAVMGYDMPWQETEALLQELGSVQRPSREAAVEVIHSLMEIIRKSVANPLLRMRATIALAHYGCVAPKALVDRGLSSRSEHVRKAVLEVLATVVRETRQVDHAIVRAVMDSLADDFVDVREAAVRALGAYLESHEHQNMVLTIRMRLFSVTETDTSREVRELAASILERRPVVASHANEKDSESVGANSDSSAADAKELLEIQGLATMHREFDRGREHDESEKEPSG